MAKKKSFTIISLLLLLIVLQLAHSRSIREDLDLVSDRRKAPAIIEWGLSASTENCEPIYGFLPCSSNVWGLLFLIVVYEILLSLAGQYIASGSEKFFEIIGPGVFGASLFQFLGTFPQIIIVLESSLSGSRDAAQQRATLGMGLVAGTTVMLLTLIWGASVILGSYDLSVANTADNSNDKNKITLKGRGIVTDVETSYTSRIMLISLAPFLILQLQNIFNTPSGRRVIILLALIATVILLFAYMGYQVFQPWVQNRRFEYLMSKYAKDKLMQLLTSNGKPDNRKILQLFNRVDKNKSSSISATELRVLLLGAKIDDSDDLTTDRNIENILESFDISGDGLVSQDEFVKGMTQLVANISNQNADSIKKGGGKNSQKTSQTQQPLLPNASGTSQTQQGLLSNASTTTQTTSSSWRTIFNATFLIILGIFMLCALSEPLIKSVVGFAQAANLSSFSVSYLAIPFAMNYGVAVQSIASAGQKTQKSISLTLSALYGGVFMNNIIGLIVFLTPVYARDLNSTVSVEVVVVLIICIVMTLLTCLRTTYPIWVGYLVLFLYPISLALVYLLTSVLGWS
ncbi:sodium/calcium exchanger NCL2-like [Henckelia pumila]|uniref:sodium/calcium exchanger NCL2-like n=1 Tax=Henckelia pumila TaxID=405737 RepID=UPI003C6E1689